MELSGCILMQAGMKRQLSDNKKGDPVDRLLKLSSFSNNSCSKKSFRLQITIVFRKSIYFYEVIFIGFAMWLSLISSVAKFIPKTNYISD
jgi:hypothetical protein